MKNTHPYLNDYFINEHGQQQYATDEIYNKVASILGTPKVQGVLPLTKVVTLKLPIEIELNAEYSAEQTTNWQILFEDNSQRQGSTSGKIISITDEIPLGYHQLTITKPDGTQESCRLIVTPQTAYQPQELQQHKKLWGTFLQLYTLRSEQNWGIGDFSDLKQFLTELAAKGGDFIGLNPIHSLFPANAEYASPYSPSSRLWQNIIYIDVNAIPAFQQSKAGQQWFNSSVIQQQLKTLREKDYVDYAQVMKLKLQGLRFAFEQFQQQDQSKFDAFITENGESLKLQGTFDALHQWLSERLPEQWGWTNWAEEYQDYHSPAVAEFQQEHADLVRFYMYLQFIADEQLKNCNQLAQDLAMLIGFYRDLAVGVTGNGAETWADKELFVLDATVGAPPDIMAPNGQDWGLAPMHPEVLQSRGYQPFIDLLRANMKNCGALRIDHILGFARMWWVAKGEPAKNGIYVRYPLEDILSILALESQRHQCLIIAEALGTVPEGMLESLERKGILAYNIFYFEQESNQIKPLANYPYQAMTTLSTHDLPTIQGYWKGYDFELGEKYGIYPSKSVLHTLKQARSYAKLYIRNAVEEVMELEPNEVGVTKKFTHQLQRYVADTNSALYGTQPEDWLNMLEPVNIPGTSSEYPNWRRKLSKTIEQIFADKDIQTLLTDINSIRKKS